MNGTDPVAAAAVIDQLAAVEGRDRLYEHYHTLRAADPIHKSRHELFPDCWFISRHSDIDQILRDDQHRPKKQRHTAKRICERLRAEHGFAGGDTIVKDYVRAKRLGGQEMFVTLEHPPGHAQADFGEALVVIDGVQRKAHYLVVDLPHSDDGFVKAFPAETTEAFCEGHNAAFRYFGGVPRSILYDNTTLAVARILGDGRRKRVGGAPLVGERVVVIEDLMSTGGSAADSVEALREEGGKVVGVQAIVSYGLPAAQQRFEALGLPTEALTDFDAILELLDLDEVRARVLREWRES